MERDQGLLSRALALAVVEGALGPARRAAEELFQRHPLTARLEPRDRAFARRLYATVFRRLGEIDRALAPLLGRRPKRLVANLLRLGAAQLLFLKTPPYAAVAATVALARRRAPAYAGLVNAVLRRLAAAPPAPLAPEQAARLNTPAWLWRRWVRHFGEAEALAIARAHLDEPPLDLQVKEDPEGWARRLEARILPDGTLRRATAPVETLAGYAEGAFWVQDAAAALAARLLGPVAGEPVLDLCAAPGGKTFQLACAGARVLAVDRSPRRAAVLRANLARLGLEAEVVVADVRAFPSDQRWPSVLLDAPCSATGTIRRHPDIPWTKREDDLLRLAALQDQLLDSAADRLAPGGRLVYAVCSLEPEEGEERIARLLARRPELVRDPIRSEELRGLPGRLSPLGEVRTLPSGLAEQGGMDGFFLARLKAAG